jgi:hypothetical protein
MEPGRRDFKFHDSQVPQIFFLDGGDRRNKSGGRPAVPAFIKMARLRHNAGSSMHRPLRFRLADASR